MAYLLPFLLEAYRQEADLPVVRHHLFLLRLQITKHTTNHFLSLVCIKSALHLRPRSLEFYCTLYPRGSPTHGWILEAALFYELLDGDFAMRGERWIWWRM